MRSNITLVCLALVGLCAGGPCKPSSRASASSNSATSSAETVDVSESSTASQTNFESLTITSSSDITEAPTLTDPQSSTTTAEEVIIITNAISGGSFANRDPNSPSGLTNFGATGNAEFHQGGCYRADGSVDDGCAALSASNNGETKRSLFGSFASIFQTVRSIPRRKYTIQFYYHINSAGSQGCVASAKFGNTEFYSQPASIQGASWARVLQQVEAVSNSPTFAISLTCSGGGISSILVDSIFISDQVTPENIDDFKLDLGGSPAIETTTAIKAEESPTLTSESSKSTENGVLDSTSIATPVSTDSQEEISSTVTGTKSTGSDPETSSAASEDSEITTASSAERTSERNIAATTTSSTSLASKETSKSKSTDTVSQEVGSTSHPATTTEPSQPTDTACKPTCNTVEDYYLHTDDFGCDLNGVFVNSDAIYTLPGEEIGTTQTHWYKSNDECAEISSAPTTTLVREPTTHITTAKASEPTGVCHNNRGQQCEINPSNVENNEYVCIGGGVFTGKSWTVPRSMYPMQENAEQCAAICDTLENCESSGFFDMENHCLFTTTKIKTSDFADPDPNYDDPGLDPKNSVWSHRSCWTCPTCVLSNAPLPKSPTCSYKSGDSCTRVSADGAMCNYSGMLSESFGIDSGTYPDQSSSGKCAAICKKIKWCLGSGYRSGRCMLSSKTLTPDAFTDRHNYNFVWDDRSCFDCPGCST
ncbi:hypothetical protein FAVG1_04766 [Fusarium avenaceum]|nr:hypothetical protein FAVG1_04766 [Fusarium avenaceum]